MSKSKGNFLTLKGTLATALDVRAFRYLVVSSQYRTTLGFSKTSLEGAKKTVQRLDKLRVRKGEKEEYTRRGGGEKEGYMRGGVANVTLSCRVLLRRFDFFLREKHTSTVYRLDRQWTGCG